MMLQRCPDPSEVARLAATSVRDLLAEPGPRHLALTGGGVGIQTLQVLASTLPGSERPKTHLWWSDERHVPRDHVDRNDVAADSALLNSLCLPPRQVHHVAGADECSLQEAADSYDEAVRALVPGGEFPVLDLVLLGAGPDGHVASLFPKQEWVSGARAVIAVPDSPKPPRARVSMTMPVLAAARRVIVVVAGREKAGALRRALDGDRALPLGELLARREAAGRATDVLADVAALSD